MQLKKLEKLIVEIESHIPQREMINKSVSSVSVGWHIEHILMATVVITEQLLRSDPAQYQWKLNSNRLLIFFLNSIPRGKGKAPATVIPKDKTSLARVEKYLEIVKEKLRAIERIQANSFIQHPYLGMLNRNASVRFMCIHVKHHLAIIQDILAAKN